MPALFEHYSPSLSQSTVARGNGPFFKLSIPQTQEYRSPRCCSVLLHWSARNSLKFSKVGYQFWSNISEQQALNKVLIAFSRIAGRPSVYMRKTAFTATTPVLHLPDKSLLQTASLFFLDFLAALLGQLSVLPIACEQGNHQQQHCSPAEQSRAVPAFLGPSPVMHDREERMKQGKKSLSNTWEEGEVNGAATELLDSFTSPHRSESLLQATDYPGRDCFL